MGSHHGEGPAEVAAGRAAVARNAAGGDATPSAVCFGSARDVVVGEEAGSTALLLPTGLPREPAGTPSRSGFHLTGTGLLDVRGRDPASGRETGFDVQTGGTDRAGVGRAEEAFAMIRASG